MKNGRDPRFKTIEKMKDREAIFIEFVTAMRKREKEDSKSRGEKVKLDFFDLLNDQHIEGGQRWSKVKDRMETDPRYKAVESSALREELFKQYMEKQAKVRRGMSVCVTRAEDQTELSDAVQPKLNVVHFVFKHSLFLFNAYFVLNKLITRNKRSLNSRRNIKSVWSNEETVMLLWNQHFVFVA